MHFKFKWERFGHFQGLTKNTLIMKLPNLTNTAMYVLCTPFTASSLPLVFGDNFARDKEAMAD